MQFPFLCAAAFNCWIRVHHASIDESTMSSDVVGLAMMLVILAATESYNFLHFAASDGFHVWNQHGQHHLNHKQHGMREESSSQNTSQTTIVPLSIRRSSSLPEDLPLLDPRRRQRHILGLRKRPEKIGLLPQSWLEITFKTREKMAFGLYFVLDHWEPSEIKIVYGLASSDIAAMHRKSARPPSYGPSNDSWMSCDDFSCTKSVKQISDLCLLKFDISV